MITLLLKAEDIPTITGFNGNIDVDALNPSINVAQTIHIKRILGADLYTKIYDDYKNDVLAGNYLTIYNDYVVYMLAFFSASIYLSLSTIKTANSGSYKIGAEGSTNATQNEVNILGKNNESIAISYENQFYEFMKTITIPEYATPQLEKNKTNLIPWH